jgi:D-tyrosyl-tRNA(Tyr) deacylase
VKGLIQRVSSASVEVSGEVVGEISKGVLLLLGVEKQDTEASAQALLEKVVGYRIFEDEAGRMNKSLRDIGGELLLVSQFTLAANTKKGRRPSFSEASEPGRAQELYKIFGEMAEAQGVRVQRGVFGADMQVSLVNDGPVTFLLEV